MDSPGAFAQRHGRRHIMGLRVDDAQVAGPFIGDVDAIAAGWRRSRPGAATTGRTERKDKNQKNASCHRESIAVSNLWAGSKNHPSVPLHPAGPAATLYPLSPGRSHKVE